MSSHVQRMTLWHYTNLLSCSMFKQGQNICKKYQEIALKAIMSCYYAGLLNSPNPIPCQLTREGSLKWSNLTLMWIHLPKSLTSIISQLLGLCHSHTRWISATKFCQLIINWILVKAQTHGQKAMHSRIFSSPQISRGVRKNIAHIQWHYIIHKDLPQSSAEFMAHEISL